MRSYWAAVGLLSCVVSLCRCSSDSPVAIPGAPGQLPDGGWSIPESPVGTAFRWLLSTINSPELRAVAGTSRRSASGEPFAPISDGGGAHDGGAAVADSGLTAGGDALVPNVESTIDIQGHFSASYLESVPETGVLSTLQRMAVVAPWELVQYEGFVTRTMLTAVIKNAVGEYWRFYLEVDGEEKISNALMRTGADLDPVLASFDGIDAALGALEGKAQWLMVSLDENGTKEMHSANADASLAVASSFKLWVLAALAQSIAVGERKWSDPLPIQDKYKSFPSGRMQDEPEGATFTLQEFAASMISLSDNTAADHLLFALGRENVEAMVAASGHHAPTQNQPFLSARELFSMRLVIPSEEQQAYLDAPIPQRREILARIDEGVDPRIAPDPVWEIPNRIDQIEWFATPADLCNVMRTLKTAADQWSMIYSILALNPGTDLPLGPYNYVGYKGGSEPGVVTRTWLVRRGSDLGWRCATFTWNDTTKDVDMDRAAYLGAAIVAAAGR